MLLCRVRLVFIGNEVGTVGTKVGDVITCVEPHDLVKTDPKDQFHLCLPSLRFSDKPDYWEASQAVAEELTT